MTLSGQQRKKLQDALIDAFPAKASLEQMLSFELDKNLRAIAGEGSLQEIVFKLIQEAESQGWFVDLVRAARKENPGNSQLQIIAQELLPLETTRYKPRILVLADAYEDENTQKIESVIKRAIKLDSFEIKVRTVITPQDIRRVVSEEHPFIVHFYTHGTEDGNLVLKDNQGNDKLVSRAVLADLFKLYANSIKCVLLNLPYSFQSAKSISQHINYVISLEQSIQENAAIIFVEVFYNKLSYEHLNNSDAIQRAFDEGILALKLDSSKGIMPDLWKSVTLHIIDKNLSSDCNVDYTKLRNFLIAGQWKQADEETLAVMLKVAGREIFGWLDDEHIENFPCTDLRTIDQLWVKYSGGRFGFSVQKRIWESVGKDYFQFADRVGWRRGWIAKEWIRYSNVTFNTTAPPGHLPALCFTWCFGFRVADKIRRELREREREFFEYFGKYGSWARGGEVLSSLASRLVNCNI
jgi:GUN4-like/Effector-associated domain 1